MSWMSSRNAKCGMLMVGGAMLMFSTSAKADLLVHLTFDGANAGTNTGTAGAISWGDAPDNGNRVTNTPDGSSYAYHTNNDQPWTNSLGAPTLTYNEFTVSFWAIGPGNGYDWRDFFSFGSVGSGLKLERVGGVEPDGQVALYSYGTNPISSFSSLVTTATTDSTNNDQWHLITLTASKTANHAVLYLDGTAQASTTWAGNAATISLFQISSQLGDGTRKMTSTFDDVRIYNQALTATDVATLYSGTSVPTPAALPAGLSLLGLAALRRRRA